MIPEPRKKNPPPSSRVEGSGLRMRAVAVLVVATTKMSLFAYPIEEGALRLLPNQ